MPKPRLFSPLGWKGAAQDFGGEAGGLLAGDFGISFGGLVGTLEECGVFYKNAGGRPKPEPNRCAAEDI